MFFSRDNTGFTLIELMIVISIMIVLFSVGVIPYNIYMDRLRVEQTVDAIGQKWTLAHTDVRNGTLFSAEKNANILIDFERGSNEIQVFLLSGSTLVKPPIQSALNTNIKKHTRIVFPKGITILSISGSTFQNPKSIGYFIEAPYGSGIFYSSPDIFHTGGLILTVGYPGGTLENLRARDISLLPQFYR